MDRIKIITPNTIVEKLLSLLMAQFPELEEKTVLLDAQWLYRIGEFSGSKVIVFTASADPAYLTAAQEAGADRFWYLQPSGEGLAGVLAGEKPFPEKAPSVQLGKARSESLTVREMDVLRQLVSGKSDADIAAALDCSLSTVKHYVSSLREKTGISSRVALAVRAATVGLINDFGKSAVDCAFD